MASSTIKKNTSLVQVLIPAGTLTTNNNGYVAIPTEYRRDGYELVAAYTTSGFIVLTLTNNSLVFVAPTTMDSAKNFTINNPIGLLYARG